VPESAPDLSIRGIATEAMVLFGRHWKTLAPIAVAVLLPQAILGTFLGEVEVDRIETVGDVIHLLAIPLFTCVSLAGEVLLAGVITALVMQWRAGRPLPGAREFVRSLPWLSLIAADVLIAIGAAIGLLLLIVPGLLFITYFAISPAVIEIERRRVWDAMRRSASLVRGHFRRVFLLIIGAIVITEGIAEGLAQLLHGFLPELVSEIAVDGLLESSQGLVIALTAISLIHLRDGGARIPAHPGGPP
jgi:Uncharacterised protein family (UPF0259)